MPNLTLTQVSRERATRFHRSENGARRIPTLVALLPRTPRPVPFISQAEGDPGECAIHVSGHVKYLLTRQT